MPLVALGLAVLLGAGRDGRDAPLDRSAPGWCRPAVVLIALLALPPLWLGRFVPENLRRPEAIPDYWNEAADHLDDQGDATRVLVVPGSDFASYRWGNTVDPILPGLMDRPSVQRELIPYGSPASANLLNAFDLGLQERTADPDALAPIARLMRAGDVLVQSDLQYERYNTPRPRNFWEFVTGAPGLGTPDRVRARGAEPHRRGRPARGRADVPDAHRPPGSRPSWRRSPSTDPVEIVATHPTDLPVLVAGDGAGLVDAAAAGLIDGSELIRYSASMTDDEIADALDDGATLVVTDSNRKRGERWTTVRHTRGYTETAGEEPLATDPTDNRLPLFPDEGDDATTVTAERGGVEAQATSYGNPITFTTEERPSLAVDGDMEHRLAHRGVLRRPRRAHRADAGRDR